MDDFQRSFHWKAVKVGLLSKTNLKKEDEFVRKIKIKQQVKTQNEQ